MGCFVVTEFLLTSVSHGPSAIAELLVVCTAMELDLLATRRAVINNVALDGLYIASRPTALEATHVAR